MLLKFGQFGKKISNTWDVWKCGTGEGRGRSVGPNVWKMKGYERVEKHSA